MKIVLLGGSGYLGRALTEKLVSQGYEVIWLCRNKRGRKGVSGVRILDLEDFSTILKEDFTLVLASGCYERDSITQEELLESNFILPAKVAIKAVEAGVHRIIYVGTSLPEGLNTYALAKNMLSKYGELLCRKNDELEFMDIHLENFYGPNEPAGRFIGDCIRQLLSDDALHLTEGTQRRDFVFINDVVENLIDLISRQHRIGYRSIPLGSGESVSVREVVTYLKQVCGSKSKLLFGSIPMRDGEPETCANMESMKAEQIVIKTSWKEGMRIVCECMRQGAKKI